MLNFIKPTAMISFSLKQLAFTIFFLLFASCIMAEEEDPKVIKMQERVNLAQARHDANYAAIESADSLLRVGNEIQKNAANEIVSLKNERKSIDRAFIKEHKPLEKNLNSKDKETVKETKLEITKITKEYKLTVKNWDTRHRAAMKELNNGEKIITRGKNNKKKAKLKLKESGTKLKEAEKILNNTLKGK